MNKTEGEAYQFLEDMTTNNCQWPSERIVPKKVVGMHDVDVFTNLAAQMSLLTKQLQNTQLKNA